MSRSFPSRKRGAPGASPLSQQQDFSSTSYQPSQDQLSYDPNFGNFLNADNAGNLNNGFGDSSGMDGSLFDTGLNGSAGYGFPDSQLVRRGNNQVVPRNPNNWQDAGGGIGDVAPIEQADEDGDLERKALEAKKEAQAKRKQIPPFVQKLSSFLDDNQNTDLIRWSDAGDSFIVLDEDEFARKLIPELFKHNNYASFVRQLNMYGFHKKVGLSDNSMKASENKRKTPSEYYNKYFRRGRPELLWLIQKPKNQPPAKRKRDDKSADSDEDRKPSPQPEAQAKAGASKPGTDVAVLPKSELNMLRQELTGLQKNQKMITQVIQSMKQQNDQFYTQARNFQEMHQRHEQSINAILTFLATFYNRSLEGNNNMDNLFNSNNNQHLPGNFNPSNIVDMGDLNVEEMPMPMRRPKQPLLLPAPEIKAEMQSPSPVPTAQTTPTVGPRRQMPQVSRMQGSASATPPVQNIPPSAPTPPMKREADSPQNMMSVINAANSASPQTGQGLDFNDALHHVQNADGNTPLTQQQRNDMLSLMQATMAGNNDLTNPQTPPFPPLQQISDRGNQLDYLQKLQEEQGTNVQQLRDRIHSLSPSGYFPTLDENATAPPPDFDLNDWMMPPDADGSFGDMNFDDLNQGNGGFADAGLQDTPDNDFLAAPEQGEGKYEGGRVQSISSRATTASPREPLQGEEDIDSPDRKRRRQMK